MKKISLLSLFIVLIGITKLQATNPIFVKNLTPGRPIQTNFLGDKLSSPWYYNFEIGQTTWDASHVGIGQNTDGSTGWNWDTASWYEDNGGNKRVRRDIGNFQFTSVGTWYVVGRAREGAADAWTYSDEADWSAETTLTCSTTTGNCSYFTVSALNTPASQTATAGNSGQINLTWSKDAQNHNVMIVRSTTNSFTAPTNETAYAVGSAIGSGTVVYNGSGTSCNDNGLNANTTYYYAFYSENNTYYSTEVTASATTISAQEYHPIKIDGTTSDWYANEQISAEHGNLSIAWDADYIYVGLLNTVSFGNADQINIAFVTNPGTNSGVTTSAFAGQTFTGYLTPDYIVQSTGTTNLGVFTRSGTSWGSANDIYSGANLYRNGGTAEIRIPRSSVGLGSTTAPFDVFVWLSNGSDASYSAYGADNADNGGMMRLAFSFLNSSNGVVVNTAVKYDYNNSGTRTLQTTSLRNLYLSDGTLTLGAATAVSGNVVFNNATLTTNGYGLTAGGTLQFDANSTINLKNWSASPPPGPGEEPNVTTSDLHFGNSSLTTWNASLITINNWTGTSAASGTGTRIFIGTAADGLNSTQKSKIQFTGFPVGATLLSTGELVPAKALYFKSNGNVSWTSATNWLTSSTENGTYTTATDAPSGVNIFKLTVLNLDVLTISTPAVTPASNLFLINGTLLLSGTGTISTAPTYGSASALEYGRTMTNGIEWTYGVSTVGVGCPFNVSVSGNSTLTISVTGASNTLFAGGSLNVGTGSSLTLDLHNGGTQGAVVLQFGATIINNGTISMSSSSNQAVQCGSFTNSGDLTLGTIAGADLHLLGNLTNTGTFTVNGRALFFKGNIDQSITGVSAINFIYINKTGGNLILNNDLICDGNGGLGYGYSINTSSNTTLNLNGYSLTLGAAGFNNGGVSGTGTLTVKGSNTSSIYVFGTKTSFSAGSITMDITTPGTTNVLNTLHINRGGADNFTVNNDYIIKNTLFVENSTLTSGANVTLDSLAVGKLSKNNAGAALAITGNLIFRRTIGKSAEFYKNGRTLTIGGTVTTRVDFARIGKWHFISFPYAVTVKKSDNSTAAVIGSSSSDGDLAAYWYDPALRAQNKSGWTQVKNNSLEAGKGYIIAKRGTLESLYFVPSTAVQGNHAVFNNTANVAATYTAATPSSLNYCNAGWNFFPHPLAASGQPSLAQGQFAYDFVYDADYYKLYYYQDNPHYTYGADAGGSIKPFSSLFVKVPVGATAVSYDISSTALGVKKNAKAQTTKEMIPLYLNVNDVKYETYVRVMTEATSGQDEMYDAPYNTPMSSSSPRLYTLVENNMYALNSVPENTVIPVGLRVPASGNYTLSWISPTTYTDATLTDAQNNTTVNMSTNNSYQFTAPASGDIANRFFINIPQQISTDIVLNSKGLRIFNTPSGFTIDNKDGNSMMYVYDITGRMMINKTITNGKTQINNLIQGIYLVKIENNNLKQTIKVIVK